MDIRASEWGLAFVKECFMRFQGEGLFLYLTVICLLYLAVRKNERWRSFWRWYGGFLVLIVFNPLIWKAVDLVGLDDEYYRCFWLIPMTPILAYTAAGWIIKKKEKWLQAACLLVSVLTIFVCGRTVFSRSWEPIENVYQIPDEVIEICEIIRADSETEEPVVASDFDLSVLINQYAPDLDLILSYREVNEIWDLRSYEAASDSPANRLMEIIYDETTHDAGFLVYALQEGNVDYIVTHRGNKARDYILESDCRLIAELKQYCIFRVEVE